jgi:hypothetical protein
MGERYCSKDMGSLRNMNKYIKTLFFTLLFIFVAVSTMVFATTLRNFYLSLIQPASEFASSIDPSIIESGDPLIVYYHFNRQRICQVDINLFVIKPDHNEVVWRNRVPGGASGLGEIDTMSIFRIPPLESGKYKFTTTVSYTCLDGNHILSFDPIEFTVK